MSNKSPQKNKAVRSSWIEWKALIITSRKSDDVTMVCSNLRYKGIPGITKETDPVISDTSFCSMIVRPDILTTRRVIDQMN